MFSMPTWLLSETGKMASRLRLHCKGLTNAIACPNPVESRKNFTVYPDGGGGINVSSLGLGPRLSISNHPPSFNFE